MNWKALVSGIAPTIGTALGGPAVGLGIKAISQALLGRPDADEAEVAQAVQSASSEQLIALKKADQQFKLDMQRLGLDLAKIQAQDRANARQMFRVDKRPQIVLSSVFTIGYFSLLGGLLSGYLSIPSGESKGAILLLIGLITREFPTIMQFWFGSSSGSKDKSAVAK